MKYDAQLTELKSLLPAAKNILVVLPAGSDIDRLASSLALFLSLTQQGKEVVIVCEDSMKVAQAHLFGVDHIQKNLPQTGGGNLTLTLEGVAASDGTVPALEKLDWYPEGNNLNLVFHVLPGQIFQPSRIAPHYQGSGFGLIFVVGAASLNSLGGIYAQNQQAFSGVHLINIDIQQVNTGFGQTNVIDANTSSISEMMLDVITSLSLPLDADVASNLLTGIFDATNNLTSAKVSADTYLALSTCLRAGGQRPQEVSSPAGPGLDLSVLMPKAAPQEVSSPVVEDFVNPTVVSSPRSSPEERPAVETVVTESEAEPDWLRPKVFKGTSLG